MVCVHDTLCNKHHSRYSDSTAQEKIYRPVSHSFFVEQHSRSNEKIRKKAEVNISAAEQYRHKVIDKFFKERFLYMLGVAEKYFGQIFNYVVKTCS